MRCRCPRSRCALFAEAASLAPEVALRRFVENALGEDPPAELVDELFALQGANPPDQAGWQAQAAAGMGFQGVDGEITAPTLILAGTADNVVDYRNAELLAARIPGARVELLRGRRASVLLGAAGRVRHDPQRVPRMNEHTIDKIIRDRARITPGRIAIEERRSHAGPTPISTRAPTSWRAASRTATASRR